MILDVVESFLIGGSFSSSPVAVESVPASPGWEIAVQALGESSLFSLLEPLREVFVLCRAWHPCHGCVLFFRFGVRQR